MEEVQVGYVDAYFEFWAHPQITAACDVILANCYPYWGSCHIDYSLMHAKQMYYQALHAGQGKKVIITETGWPSQGTALNDAAPAHHNALRYFLNIQQWARQDNIEVFYFSPSTSPGKAHRTPMSRRNIGACSGWIGRLSSWCKVC
ncbi:MAG: hypothetical protein ACE362_12600 [Phaeodactylibacter xiamenensis]|uniref:hypothetical protein n=1 Tax=Phaeodactylibacter xiamenensis TaxID=1524460 RepID=UPI00069637AD|nr:hypothetical protein [Phaeodactylibacter xiamenensis]